MMKLIPAVVTALLVPALAFAQPSDSYGADPRIIEIEPGAPLTAELHGYGISETFVHNLGPSDFVVLSGEASRFHNSIIEPALDGGTIEIVASFRLPSGVFVESVTTHYYDSHPTENPSGGAFIMSQSDSDVAFVMSTVFPAGAPGWTTATNTPNQIVDNEEFHYGYRITLKRNTAAERQRLARVSIRYRRLVSDAPATARFTDVPVGHALHQYVEALAASGITAGCTPTEFCPGQPVTRGQMAVFLAKALGLHWAP